MFKHTLIFTVIITLAATSTSFAGKGFSFGGSKHFSSKSGGSSNKHNGHHNNHHHNNHHHNANKKNFTNQFHKQGHGHQIQVKKPTFANPVVKKIDSHFNHGHKKIEINKHAVKHLGGGHHQHHNNHHHINNHHHNQHHHKPHHNQHANVWWGCHKPVHCHTVIKVPCHQPAVEEVIVEAPLSQVMVNTTIQLDMAGLSPEAGQLIVQMDQLSIPATIVEWNPVQAKATIPMLNLTGPMQATLHLVNADGSLAQSVNVELIPFNEAALVAAQ